MVPEIELWFRDSCPRKNNLPLVLRGRFCVLLVCDGHWSDRLAPSSTLSYGLNPSRPVAWSSARKRWVINAASTGSSTHSKTGERFALFPSPPPSASRVHENSLEHNKKVYDGKKKKIQIFRRRYPFTLPPFPMLTILPVLSTFPMRIFVCRIVS